MAFILMLGYSQFANAQSFWCCDNPSHAGGTAAERCEGNKQTFAKAEECADQKSKHDQATGHASRCSGEVVETRKGTASGGSRAVGKHRR